MLINNKSVHQGGSCLKAKVLPKPNIALITKQLIVAALEIFIRSSNFCLNKTLLRENLEKKMRQHYFLRIADVIVRLGVAFILIFSGGGILFFAEECRITDAGGKERMRLTGSSHVLARPDWLESNEGDLH